LRPIDLRQEQHQLAGGTHQVTETGHDRGFGREDAAQQRSPRKDDGDEICAARQRAWKTLSGFSEEKHVGQTALLDARGSPAGSVRHGRRLRVHANNKRSRLAPGAAQHGLSATRSDINHHPLVAGDEGG
jgi:hypothetical protein